MGFRVDFGADLTRAFVLGHCIIGGVGIGPIWVLWVPPPSVVVSAPHIALPKRVPGRACTHFLPRAYRRYADMRKASHRTSPMRRHLVRCSGGRHAPHRMAR